MLHAGVLKNSGLYGLLRLAIPMLPEGARHWATLLIVLLLGNIIYVGLVTIAQKRLDWMLGYSSVMHMGYIFLGIASFWCSRRDRGRCVDVRSRSLNRAAIWHRRRIAPANGHVGF
jgi:NADH-quinone oxidoreductase subunit M